MTPINKVLMIRASKKFDKRLINEIRACGHSRIPVFGRSKNQVKGLLYAKDILGLKTTGKTAYDLSRKHIIVVNENETLDDVLNQFKKTKKHLFIVKGRNSKVSGVITVEDVLEEIIGAEIVDEFDSAGRIDEFTS